MVGAAHDVCFHSRQSHLFWVDRSLKVVDALHPGDHFGAVGLGQELFGDSPGSYSADGFAGRSPAAAAAGLYAVLRLVGGIGVGGTEGHFHFPVVLRSLILVAHHHRDRCAEGHAIEQATENFDLVILLAGGGDLALAWLAAVEFGLDRF